MKLYQYTYNSLWTIFESDGTVSEIQYEWGSSFYYKGRILKESFEIPYIKRVGTIDFFLKNFVTEIDPNNILKELL